MNNPFNEQTQPEYFKNYKDITEAIDSWIAEKYPLLSQDYHLHLEKFKRISTQLDDRLNEWNKKLHHRTEIAFQENQLKYTHDLNGLCVKAEQLFKELESAKRSLVEEMKEFKKCYNQVYHSKTLFEDIYNLRDDFKDFKATMVDFKKSLKGLFKNVKEGK